MSLQHILKNSSISGKEPLASQLANGELSINYHADGPFLCCKDTAGNVRRVAGVWVSATAPSTPFPGELWLDTGITPSQLKVYKDTADAWVFAREVNSATTTTEGLVRLATDAETQVGTSAISAVTPAGLQSKVSDSTSAVSSTTLASSTAVKIVADTANAALPKSGGTITGILEIGNAGQLRFEGSSADAYETTLAVEDPTATRTITLPDRTGTVITTGDTGTVTSTMLADGTIADVDINANAEIAVSKLADGAARQLLQTDAAGTGVEWTSNVDIPGTLDVTGATTLDSTLSVPLGSAAAPSINFAGDNTGIYSPGADQLALGTGGTGRLFVDASGNVGVGTSSPSSLLYCAGSSDVIGSLVSSGASYAGLKFENSSRQYTLYIRPDTNNSLVVRDETSNAARITLDSSGRVGIGTGSPSCLLDIVRGPGVGNTIRIAAEDNHNLELARIAPAINPGSVKLGVASFGDGGLSADGGLALQALGQFSPLTFYSGGSTERMRITSDAYVRLASGTGGIQFNGDTAAANALDDYEEGTFTPAIEGNVTAGTGTYSFRNGTYSKVGNIVLARLTIAWSGHTGTGIMKFTGLPFTATQAGTGSAYINNVSLTANTVPVPYWEAWDYFVLRQNTVGGGAGGGDAQMDADGDINATIVYLAS